MSLERIAGTFNIYPLGHSPHNRPESQGAFQLTLIVCRKRLQPLHSPLEVVCLAALKFGAKAAMVLVSEMNKGE